MSETHAGADVTEDRFLDGRIRLRQPASGYRAAIDPVFLAAAVDPQPGARVLEAGAGHGTASICLAARIADCHVSGIELQADLVRLANDNARLNGLSDRVEFLIGDLVRPLPRIAAGTFDQVIANPPYLDLGRANAPPNAGKSISHVEGEAGLSAWIEFMLRMVRHKGTITLIHRADRIDEILPLLGNRAGEITLFPLWPKSGEAAKRVIIRARKGVGSPARIAAGLVVHRADGGYTPGADAVLRGAALDVSGEADSNIRGEVGGDSPAADRDINRA